MPLENMEICLDNAFHQYRPGQAVTGKVILSAKGNENIDIIATEFTLKFKGVVDINWYDFWDGAILFSSDEYFELKKVLAGDEEIVVKRGVASSSFPFSFQIPDDSDLPPSFTGEHGKVEYSLTALLIQPWKLDWSVSVKVQVTPLLKLSSIGNVSIPSECQSTKNFDFLWFKKGSQYLTVKLPKSGFVPGETIHFETKINNDSVRRVEDLSANICQVAEYTGNQTYVNGKYKVGVVSIGGGSHLSTLRCFNRKRSNGLLLETEELDSTSYMARKKGRVLFNEITRGKGVDPGATDNWSEQLKVPQVPPTSMAGGKRLISLSYFVNVKAQVEGWSNTLENFCPFTLGSVS